MQKRKRENEIQLSRKRNRSSSTSTAIESLPEDLFIEILTKVASSSFTDLINTKLTSKYFLGATNNNYIFQHVSLQIFPIISWKANPKASSFLKICRESGNPEALYRQGMLDFFSYKKQSRGLKNLKTSAEKGHVEASYVYGIILYLISSKQEGLQFLKSCEEKGLKMKECRRRIKQFVWNMWIKTFLVPENENLGCQTSYDCVKKDNKRKEWTWVDEDDEIREGICEFCKWNREALRFCNMLRTGKFSF